MVATSHPTPPDQAHEKWWRLAFNVGVVLKGIDGVLEVLGGLTLLFATQPQLLAAAQWLTRDELAEKPHAFIAGHVLHMAQHLSVGNRHFAAIYLLGHGVIKLGLVIGLLRNARWSYPTGLVFLAGFIAWQSYRLVHVPTFLLGLLTVVDVVVFVLIAHEWRYHRRHGYGRPAKGS